MAIMLSCITYTLLLTCEPSSEIKATKSIIMRDTMIVYCSNSSVLNKFHIPEGVMKCHLTDDAGNPKCGQCAAYTRPLCINPDVPKYNQALCYSGKTNPDLLENMVTIVDYYLDGHMEIHLFGKKCPECAHAWKGNNP